jgi:hypothetical protein
MFMESATQGLERLRAKIRQGTLTITLRFRSVKIVEKLPLGNGCIRPLALLKGLREEFKEVRLLYKELVPAEEPLEDEGGGNRGR